jgi:hypothetical protein
MKPIFIIMYMCSFPQYIITVDEKGVMSGPPEKAPMEAVARIKTVLEGEGNHLIRMDVDKVFDLTCI